MGAFFTNLQVRADAASLPALRAVFDADAARDGLVAAADGEPTDRAVVVVPGDAWTSVYDESTESQDHAVLDRLGKAASKALGAPAFSVLIHDSDVLRLALYQGGKRTDAYDSNPGYFSGTSRRPKPDRHVPLWLPLAPGGEAALRSVFGGGELFAEAALPVLAEALGVGPGRLDRGHRYLTDGSLGPLPEGAVTWGWRAPARPAWATPAAGPPRLETQWEQAERLYGHQRPGDATARAEAAVGGRLQISVTTMNAGGPGSGLVVEVSRDDVVLWDTVQLVLGNPRTATWSEGALAVDGDRWVARFPQAALPGGLANPRVPDSPSAMLKAMEARFGTQVHVNLIGRGARAGRSRVVVSLRPTDGEGTSEAVHVAVVGTEGRPLRSPADLHPSLLAPLRSPAHLVALVALEPAAVGRAADVVAAAGPWLPQDGKVHTTVFPGPPRAGGALAGAMAALVGGGAPKLSTGAARGFLAGKRWRDLLAAAVEQGAQVEAHWVQDAGSIASGAALHLGAGILPPPDAAPVLTLGLPPNDADAEAALVAAIDALARDGVLLQAFVTRWGGVPAPDTTPYELACGVSGQCTTQRSWATRWLRGIGPGWSWLGPDLAARVDAAAVDGVRVGPGLRLQVRDATRTEQALADLLPGPADWQAAVLRRYGR